MNNTSKILALSALFILGLAYVATAQVPPGGQSVPIDGGVVTVVGAGLLYGVKKLYDRNKNSENNQ